METLIQGRVHEPSPSARPGDFPSTSPTIPPDDLGFPVINQHTQWKPPFINIETVLEWPVFDRHDYRQRIQLLNPPDEIISETGLQVFVDFDLRDSDALVRRFFDNVNIFNPILEEEGVSECSKVVHFNGIGWDARSCLLVIALSLPKCV